MIARIPRLLAALALLGAATPGTPAATPGTPATAHGTPAATPATPAATLGSPATAESPRNAGPIVRATPDVTVTFDGTIHAMAYEGDRIYLGGDFTHAIDRGRLVVRTRLAALDARTGRLLPWNPSADGRVRALAATDTAVVIGGDFGTVNGVSRDNLARLDPETGAVGAFRHTVYGHPHAIAIGPDRVYVGGTLTQVDGQPRRNVAAFDLATGALDPQWKPNAQAAVDALVVAGDRVFLGGAFTKIDEVRGSARIAVVDARSGSVRPGFSTTIGYAVSSLSLSNGTLYAAVGGRGGRAVALDASTGRTRWIATADGDVEAVVRVGDMVFMGGHFDHICASNQVGDKGVCRTGSTVRIKIAALDLSGRLLPWLADANGIMGVETMAISPELGKLAAGGSFTEINGAAQRRFAQFQR
ncbi:MAG: PQQ-binding-like beta-propeller repeat protein [Hamadaea sp.]|nr:PQQ-binding-like beta-propeller repeat protein [Hamadaea sp.]